MSRFAVGDVVIHRDHPSRPETVRECYVVQRARDGTEVCMVQTSKSEGAEWCYHGTGMRVVGKVK